MAYGIKAGVVVVILLLGLASPVTAGPLDDAISAIAHEDYATGLRLLRPLAKQGDAKAQSLLAFMYDAGQGVPQNGTEAEKWYRRAGDQGILKAQSRLGMMYLSGQGVSRNETESVVWFRKAADQGDQDAQWQLADSYAEGRGVPKDMAAAAHWYRRAADQGNALARFRLGQLFEAGQGVSQDEVAAYMWYSLAASGSPPGAFRDEIAPALELVARRMTPTQIVEAQRLAREWKPR